MESLDDETGRLSAPVARASTAMTTKRPAKSSGRREGVRASGPPPFRPVQLATLVDTVPTGDRWLHEIKYDGYRVLIAVGGGEARAYTRSGLDWSENFAGIVAAAARLDVGSALIDGEAAVLEADGRSSSRLSRAPSRVPRRASTIMLSTCSSSMAKI
jgi:bifunctional non-homologous end joining protein LigD